MRAALALATLALVAAACGDTAATTTASVVPATTSPVATPPPTASTSAAVSSTTVPAATTVPVATAPTTVAGRAVAVEVSEGAVEGGGRFEVRVDDQVSLTVTSDVGDEVHVHGYDIFTTVGAGETVAVEFVADIPGIFEVELEGAGLELIELVVEP